MDYEKAIDEILAVVKGATGMTSEEISASINRGISYISSAKKGTNAEQCYNLLRGKYADLLKDKLPSDHINLLAQLQALQEALVLLKAEVKNLPVDDVQSELERRATLILNNLRKSNKK